MAVTREKPTARTQDPDDDEIFDQDDLDDLYEPPTEKPKNNRKQSFLQRKRERAALGLIRAGAYAAGFLGRFKFVPILPEDIAAVHVHARPIAQALAETAEEDEKFARVFDRLTELGPYAAIGEAIMPLIIQFVANRRAKNNPAMAAAMGAIPPDQLMAMFQADVAEAEQTMNGDGNAA